MEPKTKTFDAVAMKRRGARVIHEHTAGMTREEELAFWKARTQELRALLQRRREKQPPA